MTDHAIAMQSAATILWVEDEADLREDVAEELSEEGFLVVQAASGEQALQALARVRPDLILCDITMPGISGYELLECVRADYPDLSDIPFVFLTARADSSQIIEGKRAGADDYLVKPVDFDLMLATIHARLQQVRRIRQHHHVELAAMQKGLDGIHEQHVRETLDQVATAFDMVRVGIVLLDEQTQIRFANQAANLMAAAVDGLVLQGRIQFGDAAVSSAFSRAAQSMLESDEGPEDTIECFNLPRSDGQGDLVLMMSPVGRNASRQDGAVALMLLMTDPRFTRPVAPGLLASLFRLTPAEADIANAFARGERSAGIAARLGISATTVAFHKRNIFEKTGTNRQADLVALMLALPVDISS